MRKLMVLATLLTIAFAAESQIGSFTVSITTDELTDEKVILAFTKAISYPDAANDAALILRCVRDAFDIYIYADEFLNIDDEVPAQYKIDGVLVKDPTTFTPSTDGTAAFAFAPKAFLVDLVNGDDSDMVIRLWDYQGTPYTYKFRLEGLMDVLRLMQPSCISEIPTPKW